MKRPPDEPRDRTTNVLQQTTVATNIQWFHDNDQYQKIQASLECYKDSKRIVERVVRGVKDVLDVGNGGVFNYDTGLGAAWRKCTGACDRAARP